MQNASEFFNFSAFFRHSSYRQWNPGDRHCRWIIFISPLKFFRHEEECVARPRKMPIGLPPSSDSREQWARAIRCFLDWNQLRKVGRRCSQVSDSNQCGWVPFRYDSKTNKGDNIEFVIGFTWHCVDCNRAGRGATEFPSNSFIHRKREAFNGRLIDATIRQWQPTHLHPPSSIQSKAQAIKVD